VAGGRVLHLFAGKVRVAENARQDVVQVVADPGRQFSSSPEALRPDLFFFQTLAGGDVPNRDNGADEAATPVVEGRGTGFQGPVVTAVPRGQLQSGSFPSAEVGNGVERGEQIGLEASNEPVSSQVERAAEGGVRP
jgi:hypothetical protein